MRKEYELRDGRPNPYAQRLGPSGAAAVLEEFVRSEHYVRIDPDLLAAFGSEKAVNEALRLALRMTELLSAPVSSAAASKRPPRSR